MQVISQPPLRAQDDVAASPLAQFIAQTHASLAVEKSGAVADYIPELGKADAQHFGIALATLDGHVYEIGDSAIPFTIQSISKAFVFALALETVGAQRIEAAIGVEPSGEAFNSIRLRADNRPFNPMVNAGAIACSGLMYEAAGEAAFERIRVALGQFAGRELGIDEAVFRSEKATGDRNRAIAYLLHNYGIVKGDVDAVLDVYFRQCSLLVTARDLALMAATLANGGINPLNGERVVAPYTVARTLSVMTSSGMYDFAGEWIYRVGIPAKSGVGGGIMAALPGQLGLGTFSPLLDEHGNSIRGLKVCEALSARFDLHMLNGTSDVRTCIVADYDFARVSPRGRQPHEQKILDGHENAVRVLELTGALSFANVDLIARRIHAKPLPLVLILDFSRVPMISTGAAKMLANLLDSLQADGAMAVVSGIERGSPTFEAMAALLAKETRMRAFASLDEAIEWAEDQIIFRFGGFSHLLDTTGLGEQELLATLPAELIEEIARLGVLREFHTGQQIIASGDASDSIFFLQSGMVSVKRSDGLRLATLVPGMAFGEMALVEAHRSADVWADTAVRCVELPLDRFHAFRLMHPEVGERIMRNLARLLSHRLGRANTRITMLGAR
jgi:glutaminase